MSTPQPDRNPTAVSATSPVDDPAGERANRPYVAPALVELGRVEDLTQGGGTGGPPEPVGSGV